MLLVVVIVAATLVSVNTVVTSSPSSCISWLTKMVWNISDVAMPVSVLSLSNTVGCFYTLFLTFSLLFSGFIHCNPLLSNLIG